jgi:hypothetical protein
MSDLITRLRRRAHLPEFRICGEAADALKAAEQERDIANRRYEQVWTEWERDLEEDRKVTRVISSRAIATV